MLAKVLVSHEEIVLLASNDGASSTVVRKTLPLSFHQGNFVAWLHKHRKGLGIGTIFPTQDRTTSAFSSLSQALCWPDLLNAILPTVETAPSHVLLEISPALSSTPLHYLPKISNDEEHRIWSSIAGSSIWVYRIIPTNSVGYTWSQYVDRMRDTIKITSIELFQGEGKNDAEKTLFSQTLHEMKKRIGEERIDILMNDQATNSDDPRDLVVYFGHSEEAGKTLTISGLNAEDFASYCSKKRAKLIILGCCDGAVPHIFDQTSSFVEAFAKKTIPIVSAQWKPHQKPTAEFLLNLVPKICQSEITIIDLVRLVCEAELQCEALLQREAELQREALLQPEAKLQLEAEFEPIGFSLFL